MAIRITLAALIAASAGAAGAQVIDGQINEAGYQLIWSNNEGTGFGNNRSEIDGIWAYSDGVNLYLGVTGNVQDFNKLDLFFDSTAGGQNSLRGDNADVDFNQLNTNLGGLTFDAGFEADYFLTYTVSGDRTQHFTGAAQLDTMGGGPGGFQGGGNYVDGDQIVAGGANGLGYVLGTNQSNTGGVADFGNPNDSDPALVMTGMELSIPLAELGYTGGALRLAGFINGGSHDFLSNQVIGGLPAGTGNLGGDGAGNFTGTVSGIDFNQFAGDQYVTLLVPSPSSLALIGLGGLVAVRRRR
ncbi:MAG TPA: PEP-CTERM sorting domain-containing protein [Phycisphaerales bacterium]|nr:PEP-CTERM sorting domain-containing protein [Phycisphaerales bacterium]